MSPFLLNYIRMSDSRAAMLLSSLYIVRKVRFVLSNGTDDSAVFIFLDSILGNINVN